MVIFYSYCECCITAEHIYSGKLPLGFVRRIKRVDHIYVFKRHATEEYYEISYTIFVRKSEDRIAFPNVRVNGWIM